MTDINEYMIELGQQAKTAAKALQLAETDLKNQALLAIAKHVSESQAAILAANEQDMEQGRESGLDSALLDRLALTPQRIDNMVEGL